MKKKRPAKESKKPIRNPAQPKQAFISHSTPDDRFVQEMVQYLRKLGYTAVFNDSDTIEPDERFWPRIEKGIRECDAFVVVLSHASVKSHWGGNVNDS